MEKDIIQPVNISILNDMLKEQEQKYEKKIAELENKIKDLNSMTGIFSARLAGKYEKKLNKIKKYLQKECKIIKENQTEEKICDTQCETYNCLIRILLEMIKEN